MKKILLGVSASIAAYTACDLITEMRKKNLEVRVVMTKDAHHFITPLTLQSMAGSEVIQDFFQVEGRVKPVHIELAKNSDLILISPATADIIAKLAHGFADDVLTCTVLASDAPVVIVPAMNTKMYENKATQENIQKLKSRGFKFVDPIDGHLVCSDQGMGHIAENSSILKAVQSLLTSKK